MGSGPPPAASTLSCLRSTVCALNATDPERSLTKDTLDRSLLIVNEKSLNTLSYFDMWSWGESNPRPLGGYRTRYDHSCTAASMATALAGQRASQGGHHQVFPRCQCSFTRSVVFPYGPSTLLLPGCMDQAPCAVTGHDDSLQPGLNQAARANCSLAVHFVPPFNESVATRVANSTSRSQRRNQSAPLHCCTALLLCWCCAVLLHR